MTSFMSAAYGRPVDIKPRNDEKNKKKWIVDFFDQFWPVLINFDEFDERVAFAPLVNASSYEAQDDQI